MISYLFFFFFFFFLIGIHYMQGMKLSGMNLQEKEAQKKKIKGYRKPL